MARESIAPEQSVEEILDSIRQIISDDEEALMAMPEEAHRNSGIEGIVRPKDEPSGDEASRIADALSGTVGRGDRVSPDKSEMVDDDQWAEDVGGRAAFDSSRSIFKDLRGTDHRQHESDHSEGHDRLSQMREQISSSLTLRGEDQQDSRRAKPEGSATTSERGPTWLRQTAPSSRPIPEKPEPKSELPTETPDRSDDLPISSISAIRDRLLAEETKNSVAKSFEELSHSISSEASRSLEDVVSDMLKPQLKIWLDENLPRLVERMVREEIERVSQKRG